MRHPDDDRGGHGRGGQRLALHRGHQLGTRRARLLRAHAYQRHKEAPETSPVGRCAPNLGRRDAEQVPPAADQRRRGGKRRGGPRAIVKPLLGIHSKENGLPGGRAQDSTTGILRQCEDGHGGRRDGVPPGRQGRRPAGVDRTALPTRLPGPDELAGRPAGQDSEEDRGRRRAQSRRGQSAEEGRDVRGGDRWQGCLRAVPGRGRALVVR